MGAERKASERVGSLIIFRAAAPLLSFFGFSGFFTEIRRKDIHLTKRSFISQLTNKSAQSRIPITKRAYTSQSLWTSMHFETR